MIRYHVNKMSLPSLLLGLSLFARCLLLLSLCSFADAAKSSVNGVAAAGNDSYSPSFFQQYNPQNALEMIERLPGFSFNGGAMARGFGGNGGNILVDGVRPVAKSGGLAGALSRIPAQQVARIDVFRAGIGAGDAGGHAVVANVIRDRRATSATWTVKTYRAPDGVIKPSMETIIARRMGDWSTLIELKAGSKADHRSAVTEIFDVQGAVSSITREARPSETRWRIFSGEGTRDIGVGSLTINSRIARFVSEVETERDINELSLNSLGPVNAYWQLKENRVHDIIELGADFTRNSDRWRWRLMGLGQVEENRYQNHSRSDYAGAIDDSSDRYSKNRIQSEFIARTTFSRLGNSNFNPQFGLEIANNKLDAQIASYSDGVPDTLDSEDVAVEEFRAELFASFVMAASERLNLEGGLTAEVSEISVSADTEQRQRFQFIKPRLSSTLKVGDDSRIVLEAEHRVGQLNFNDFASSSQASDDRTVAGNPDLVPDQATAVTASYDWNFSSLGNFKVAAFHEWRSDILENIVLPSGDHGLGNAGDARYWGVVTDLNIPLDLIMPNGLIEISYKYRRSSFDDPIIGGERSIASYAPDWLYFKFRQDLLAAKFAWGGEYYGSFDRTGYLVDEIQTTQGNKRVRLYVESTRFFGVKSKLEISNLNTGHYRRSRYLYEPDRNGILSSSEISKRSQRPEVKLSFSGKF